MTILDALGLMVLAGIAWEDLRHRAIHWGWLPALFGCLALPTLVRAQPWYADAAPNLLFLVVQFAAALGLLFLRQRRFTNPVDNWVGLGDLLFLLVVAFALPRWSFLLYYLSGLALCLPAQWALRKFSPRTTATVPLAGFLAIYLGAWILALRSGVLAAWTEHPPLALAHG